MVRVGAWLPVLCDRLFRSGAHYALAVVLLTMATLQRTDAPWPPMAYWCAICCATLYAYAPRRSVRWLGACVACAPLMPALTGTQLGHMLACAVAALCLYMGYRGVFGMRPLRDHGRVKPFLVAAVWVLVVVGLPLAWSGIPGRTGAVPWLLLDLFAYMAALCVLFDIKDHMEDRRAQLGTWVVRLGLRRTLFAVVLPLVLLAALARAFSLHTNDPLKVLVAMLPYVAFLLLLRAFRYRRGPLFHLVVVDGMMLLKALCDLIA